MLVTLNFVADFYVFYFTFLKVEPPTLKDRDSSFIEILLNFSRSFNGSSYRNISYAFILYLKEDGFALPMIKSKNKPHCGAKGDMNDLFLELCRRGDY